MLFFYSEILSSSLTSELLSFWRRSFGLPAATLLFLLLLVLLILVCWIPWAIRPSKSISNLSERFLLLIEDRSGNCISIKPGNPTTDDRTTLNAPMLYLWWSDIERAPYLRVCSEHSKMADRTGKFVLLTYSLTTSHQTAVHCCSTEGTLWGPVCSWTGPWLWWHISFLELLEVLFALIRLRPLLQGKHVLVQTDNTVTRRSMLMLQLARHLLLWSRTWLKLLRAIHIQGKLNHASDAFSQQLTLPGKWELHPQVVQLIWSWSGKDQLQICSFLLENYRPVSLLPFVAKTLERVVFNQLSLFLSQYNKLDVKQSGFRSGHSTETALLSVTEALRVAKADSKSSVLILLDLSAAFDTVNHQILLSTLLSLGITGIPLRWFESYLTGRSFRVAWGGEVSKAHQLVTGVPQGSVLGPLLFSTYTTSLGPIIQAHGFSYHCYADDTQLYLSFQPDDPTVAARISGCLADISAWMKEHHLQLNLAKTELLVVPATPTLQHDFSIQLGTSIITPSTSVRNLGVIFDDQLTFKEHIAKTARSCRFALHNIRKIRPFLTEHAAQLLVQALVVSRLDYCNALLAGLPSNTIKPLQMIQNAAARLVFNEPKITHVTPLFISLHWLPVAARIKFKTLMLAYRTTTGSAPSYFHSLLRIYIPSRSLRSASERRLVVPSQRGSKSLSRTFSFTIPGWWNNLPTPIRNAGSLSIFKQQLKTHLFRHYLTSS